MENQENNTNQVEPVRPDVIYYILRWIGGFCDILDGVGTVVTFGFYRPYLNLKMAIYNAKGLSRRRGWLGEKNTDGS